ncbi:MAG: T9SS type A sorting domain-containing protein, partial [Bacteroidia bacterium]|nr:T9SS type A sorting domain-containing protein [Bacteroidia bacterium]
LRLYNLFGQEVLRESFSGRANISGCSPGIYLVTLSGSSGLVLASAKLVISR